MVRPKALQMSKVLQELESELGKCNSGDTYAYSHNKEVLCDR